jgi:SNF2 family DNA or RNA helicase
MLRLENLHEYQRRLIEKSKQIPHMGLLMDMGLGKTITTLTIIKGKTLIIAPKAVAKNVWRQEAKQWEHTTQLKFALIVGTPQERMDALHSPADVYIVNVENVVWLMQQTNLPQWTTLVIDESSRFKNPTSKRWKALKGMLKNFQHRYILTGTPTPKSYLDLWTQVSILDLGHRLGSSMTKFKEQYFEPDQKDRRTGVVWSWKLKPGAKELIDAKISDVCFSLRADDYLKMPERQDITHQIEWSKKALDIYKRMKKDMVAEVKGDTVTAVTAGVLTNKLLQITSGEIYNEEKKVTEVHTDKVEYLLDMIDETPTLIFYNYKHALNRLRKALPDAVVLDPDDEATIKGWREGKISTLLCHPKSVGIGLNLQCNVGDTAQIVWFDLPWSGEDYLQANARVFRQGQTKPVIVHHLTMAKSIDAQVMDVLQGKIDTQEALMNALKLQ